MSNASIAVELFPACDHPLRATVEQVIPAIDPSVRLSPFHERGSDGERYLVESGNACFVVGRGLHDIIEILRDQRPATIGELAVALRRRTGEDLAPDNLVNIVTAVLPRPLFEPALARAIQTPFIIRTTLLRKEWLEPVTKRLTWMYARPVAVVLLTVATLIAVFAVPRAMTAVHTAFTVRELALLYVGIFLSGLWHELGHATACKHYGCPHGDIGFGLYFIFPAFYSDVTKAWRLQARQRAVVDLGGMYFQSLVVIIAGGYGLWTGNVVALRFLWVTLFMMLYNLNPVFKLDGYWLFSDLSGLTNLHKRMRETFMARLRRNKGSVSTPIFFAYLGAAVLYGAYLTHFLAGAFAKLATHYPAAAGEYVRAAAQAMDAQQWLGSAAAAGNLVRISIWPLILCVVVTSLSVRIFKLFRGART
jgi:putative peptide zinc metalloprotease protein